MTLICTYCNKEVNRIRPYTIRVDAVNGACDEIMLCDDCETEAVTKLFQIMPVDVGQAWVRIVRQGKTT